MKYTKKELELGMELYAGLARCASGGDDEFIYHTLKDDDCLLEYMSDGRSEDDAQKAREVIYWMQSEGDADLPNPEHYTEVHFDGVGFKKALTEAFAESEV